MAAEKKDPNVCQRCGRDLYAGPLVKTDHTDKPIHEARIGAAVVDTSGDRLLLICRDCRVRGDA